MSQRCRGLHWQLFFHVLFYPMSFDTSGLLTSGLHSLFSTLFARSNWGDLLCGNIYHLLHSGSCSHDVSTLCLFLLKTQTVGWILGRGIVVISTWKQQPFQQAQCRKICLFGHLVSTLNLISQLKAAAHLTIYHGSETTHIILESFLPLQSSLLDIDTTTTHTTAKENRQ